jgi:hypothetical protein
VTGRARPKYRRITAQRALSLLMQLERARGATPALDVYSVREVADALESHVRAVLQKGKA